MKSSLSSSPTAFAGGHGSCRLLILLFLLFLIFASSANCSILSPTSQSETSSRTTRGHPGSHRYCDSFSRENSRSLCTQLQKLQQHHRLRPPLPPQVTDIDPRYGAEKRLVPSGPNPLHN